MHASFTPLVLSATGGMANKATTFYKRLASIIKNLSKSIKWTWAEPFEINVKIEQEFNFVDDSRLFLDAQEAKKR